ncbi:hypothetical protein PPTG_10723, partial [Phytophthora nicotianae INRA-310]
NEGEKPESCLGRIQATGVNFTYPSRPDVQILNDYNVTIEPGQTVAFVGASGGGKSTLISLLERFYDPQEGSILLDGRDVKTLNVKWLRSQIGLVSQEPVLFATTIFENIAAGGNEISRDQVMAAAKLANAHNFIMSLPEQYDTLVGEKGVSLSGGQKQRVAIARAIVREPKILVLDEATSALDAESERVVQAALNDLMDKTRMTTLVIAHRLSTVRRADKIVVVNGGHVVEEGNHDELVTIEDGIYNKLYTIQEEKAQEEAEAVTTSVNDEDIQRGLPRRVSSRSVNDDAGFTNCEVESQAAETMSKFTIFDAIAFSRPERKTFIVGIIASGILGCALPVSAVLISELVALYTIQEEKAQEEAEAVTTSVNDEDIQRGLPRRVSSRSVNDDAGFTNCEVESQAAETMSKFTIFDAIAFSRPERKTFIVGIIASGILGCALPVSAVLISELVAVMTTKYSEYQTSHDQSALDDLKHDVMVYGLCYIAGAVVVFLSAFVQNYAFKYMAEKLTSRLRNIHFTALCRQNIGFFDEKKNATGALTADLSTNATKVALISGDSQGRVVQVIFTFAAALVVSFAFGSWLLTLVMLAVFPFLIMGQAARGKHMKTAGGLSDELSGVGAQASEALSNIRTVASLGLEESLTGKLSDLLEEPLTRGRREAHVNGFALGFGSFVLFAAYALAFWYGGKLVDDGDITFKELMRTLMAIMMSAQGIGMASTFVADSDHALKAGKAIVNLRDREPPIDSFDEKGLRPAQLEGRIDFQNVTFRYPTRPEITVLKNYNLTIEAGQTVAFCGPSGGGKSTPSIAGRG